MLPGHETRFTSEGLGRYGRYRAERLIGSGSAGAVFLGRDPILGRPVAIKVVPLRSCRSSEERAERLELLRRAFGPLGSLAHPNLVTVHDVGIEEEHSFVIMEYVPGRDLSGHLADGSLPPERVSTLASQLAGALDFAHGHDLTHGDLKPTNVLVTPGWEVKITDLAVVSALAASGLGHANSRWDEPEHLAPEVAEGEEPSPASDRFAFGVLLYSLLTGRPPFQGDDATSTLWRIANEQPPLPSDLAPEVPVAVDGVFLRALAKRPEERFGSCAEMAEALQDALTSREPAIPAVYATQPLDDDLRRQLRIAGSETTPLDPGRLESTPLVTTAPVRTAPDPPPPEKRQRLWPWAAALVALLALAAAYLGRDAWLQGGGERLEPAAGVPVFSWDASAGPERTPSAEAPSPPHEGTESAEPGAPDDVGPGAGPLAVESDREPRREPEPEPATGPEEQGVERVPAPTAAVETSRSAEPPPGEVAPGRTRLRVRLASEVSTGTVTLWIEDRVLLERRFHFGGPLQRLRRNTAPGGQWEEIVTVDSGPAALRVRVTLPSGTMEEIPIRRVLLAGEERILEIRISPHREISARLR